MLGSTTISLYVKLIGPIFLVAFSFWYLGISRQQVDDVVRKFRSQRDLFISDFLEHEIDGRFDGHAISNLCTSRKWTPKLVMTCDGAHGGIGMVRNAVLHCFRFAIEAGAELVLPEIVPRSDDDLKAVTGRPGMGLDHFFDTAHLHGILTTYCPQLKVYGSFNDLYNVPEVAHGIEFSMGELGVELVNGSVLANASAWSQQFRDFLDRKSPPETREYPLRVHLKHTISVWPTASDTLAVASSFGRILRIRTDARRLAASTLFSLAVRFRLKLDPRTRYHPESFVGVHLRTETDVDDKFPDYITQAANYLHYLSESGSAVAFLASGATQDNVTAFTERARDFNVTVVTKADILDDAEQAVLAGLTWDQRGLVDYEIMLRAGLVAGVGASSFAWNLALRRSYAFGTGPADVPASDAEFIAWRDHFTTLFGKHERADAFRATIWP